MSEKTAAHDAEPIEVGWYAYSGGAQTMIFHLRESGQWSAHFDNGTAGDCAWGYIEQALGVWSLRRIDLPILTEHVCTDECGPELGHDYAVMAPEGSGA